jgi:hypothetical protein
MVSALLTSKIKATRKEAKPITNQTTRTGPHEGRSGQCSVPFLSRFGLGPSHLRDRHWYLHRDRDLGRRGRGPLGSGRDRRAPGHRLRRYLRPPVPPPRGRYWSGGQTTASGNHSDPVRRGERRSSRGPIVLAIAPRKGCRRRLRGGMYARGLSDSRSTGSPGPQRSTTSAGGRVSAWRRHWRSWPPWVSGSYCQLSRTQRLLEALPPG